MSLKLPYVVYACGILFTPGITFVRLMFEVEGKDRVLPGVGMGYFMIAGFALCLIAVSMMKASVLRRLVLAGVSIIAIFLALLLTGAILIVFRGLEGIQ